MADKSGYMICRVCGLLVNENHKDECPACGAPITSFTPYFMKVSEKRYKFLELHLHPISTHLAVGYTMTALLVMIIYFIKPTVLGINMGYDGVLEFMIYAQPFFILLTGALGIVDGKLRYKKLLTRYLILKMILGSTILITSILTLVVHYLSNKGSKVAFVSLEVVLIVINFGIAGLLGKIGSQLTCPIVPRGKEQQN